MQLKVSEKGLSFFERQWYEVIFLALFILCGLWYVVSLLAQTYFIFQIVFLRMLFKPFGDKESMNDVYEWSWTDHVIDGRDDWRQDMSDPFLYWTRHK